MLRVRSAPCTHAVCRHALAPPPSPLLPLPDAAIREVARIAEEVNTNVDNIGARRLHTILERIVEDISFDAPEKVGLVVGAGGGGARGGGGAGEGHSQRASAAQALAVQAKESGSRVIVVVDKEQVQEKLGDLLKKQDLSKYVL